MYITQCYSHAASRIQDTDFRPPGRGKSGGARVLIASRLAEQWFFLFGFAKNERGATDDRELAVLQMTAEALLERGVRSLEMAIQAGELTEICDEEEPHTG